MSVADVTSGKQTCLYNYVSRSINIPRNLSEDLFDKSKLAQHAYEEHNKIYLKEARPCKLNRIAYTINARKQRT
jgi:hypothetical protein